MFRAEHLDLDLTQWLTKCERARRGLAESVRIRGRDSGPELGQPLAASKVAEFAVVYDVTERFGRDTSKGEQSWFAKPPRARFDFSSDVAGQRTTVSLYALADGAFLCYQDAAQPLCFGTFGLSTAIQQNAAASAQVALAEHPERFSGTLIEQRQIAGQDAYCYDVRAVTPQASGLAGGRFCYSRQGIPLLFFFATQGGEVSMEATRVSTTARDSDFTLPTVPTTQGRP